MSDNDLKYVKWTTSKGDVVIEVHPEWAPLGAERFIELVKEGYYDGCRFFRVIPKFVAQVGIAADPDVSSQWRNKTIKDDPVKQTNARGTIVFATAGPNTRTTQLFINFRDNSGLDAQGFAPFGKVVEGMDAIDNLHKEEVDDQGRIHREGNEFLNASHPKLDYIEKAEVVDKPA